MKPTINKSRIMKEAHSRYKKFKGTNQVIYGRKRNDVYTTEFRCWIFADCLALAWLNELYRYDNAMHEYAIEQERKRMEIYHQTDRYKAWKKQQEENPFAWMEHESIYEFYRTAKYQGD